MKKTLLAFVLLFVALLSVSADVPERLGDVNCDELLDISDVTSLIDYLLQDEQGTFNNANADVDRDGRIDIGDLTRLIDHLLGDAEWESTVVKTYTANGVNFNMVVVDGGTFTMGLTTPVGQFSYRRDEEPAHEVTLPSYEIGMTEVTRELWHAVMGDIPSSLCEANVQDEDLRLPVEMVSWNDCQTFIAKLNQMTGLNFRLPTEAEWEFAARGGNLSKGYLYAGSNNLDEVAWHGAFSNDDEMTTQVVASKKPNELGLYDMSGNVWEWCNDYYDDYRPMAQYNPTGPSTGEERVLRGGYFSYDDTTICRVSARLNGGSEDQSRFFGLRLALGEDHSLRLSNDALTIPVGGEATVNIINGSGAYTVTGGGDSISVNVEGDRLTVTGNQVGVAQVHVIDDATGVERVLRVIVAASIQTFTVNGVSFTMVGVEGGTFMMGAADDDLEAEAEERPAHEVTLSSYSIGQTEVTQALWFAVMGEYYASYPRNRYSDHWNQPVDDVEWKDCIEFIIRLNKLTGKHFRLPTEAEWEFAARGGRYSKGYKYSGSNSIDDVAWYYGNCEVGQNILSNNPDNANAPVLPVGPVSLNGSNRVGIPDDLYNMGPQPVASKLPNELGLYDMSGNVVEYCQDVFGQYSSEAQTDPVCDDVNYKVGCRGGKCDAPASWCRVSYRGDAIAWWNNGLRLVLDDENSAKFGLSETQLQLFIGESKTVMVLNGSGDYTVTDSDGGVYSSIEGDRLTLTGRATGVSRVCVTDNATGASSVINVWTYLDAETICFENDQPFLRMVSVKGGTFTMGATAEQGDDYQEDERPIHEVTLSDFYIGETEVLQSVWREVMHSDPSHFHYQPPYESPKKEANSYEEPQINYEQLPVEQISWYDCQKFIAKLNMRTGKNFRLPTEAEWEYAARGGHLGRGYKYAGGDSIDQLARYGADRFGPYVTSWVASNELGVKAMSGNVWEWCQDWYGAYSSDAQNDPSGPATGSYRVMRGGSWNSDSSECRVSNRDSRQPEYWNDNLGMRLARDADNSPKFRLSQTVVELGEAEGMTINILNGHGAYSFHIVEGENNVNVDLDGSVINVEGVAEGVSTIRVTDVATQSSADLVVVVVIGDEVFTVNGVRFVMKHVKGGSFMMGKSYTDDDYVKPAHPVTLSTYRIGQTEVTQQLWEAVMGSNPSRFKGDPYRPVEQVSWNDCQEFITKLNELTGRKFRLPTEAEWEYAARDGEALESFDYAGSNSINNVAWFYSNSYAVGPEHYNYGTHSVAHKSANALQLYDMSGNVWEWCQDWFGGYSIDEQTNPTGPATGYYRVSRGGSWCNSAKFCEVTARNYASPSYKEYYMGLRLAL